MGSNEVHHGIHRLFPRLWRYCLALAGNRDSAADLAQAACLKAIEKQEQFQAGSELDRWLFRIAKNTWTNQLRYDALRSQGSLDAIDTNDIADLLQSDERHSAARDIVARVMGLPEAQRLSVLLVYVEGYSYKEAADILAIPVGTVMSRLASARSKLQTDLSSYQRQLS